MNRILVLGVGYIGSHSTLALLQGGYEVVVLDNLCNSSPESLKRLSKLAGRLPVFVHVDISDRTVLDCLFAEHAIEAVLRFAGSKAVGESVTEPLRYYDNNVHGSQVLLNRPAFRGGQLV